LSILVDTLYDARTLLIASAEVPPEQIYVADEGVWEFRPAVGLHRQPAAAVDYGKFKGRGDSATAARPM
jgi:predicted ATPase